MITRSMWRPEIVSDAQRSTRAAQALYETYLMPKYSFRHCHTLSPAVIEVRRGDRNPPSIGLVGPDDQDLGRPLTELPGYARRARRAGPGEPGLAGGPPGHRSVRPAPREPMTITHHACGRTDVHGAIRYDESLDGTAFKFPVRYHAFKIQPMPLICSPPFSGNGLAGRGMITP